MSEPNYVCIHAHFYQPERENPFTGLIDEAESAAPWANWNERITEECYAANASARILGDDGSVVRRLRTYEWISFDFGPTLLDWMDTNAPEVHRAIIESDRGSAERFGGFGSAMAQGYHHTILPLSNTRDKRTQVRWGIADFEHRFGRSPQGMWLPETAVDLETLEVLADEGIRYTVLAPRQAAAIRDERQQWTDVIGGTIDTRRPYRVELPGDKAISVFFYDGALSREIAFDGILDDGRRLAERLAAPLGGPSTGPSLSHVATDGETYGHHHRSGEMALAKAIEELDRGSGVMLTNYAQFLSIRPPRDVVRIIENSSWSCEHGVDRWQADCGCSTGAKPGWQQRWRAPLREALNDLRDRSIQLFEEAGSGVFADPWAARDAYVEVLLTGDEPPFLDRHGRPGLTGQQKRLAIALMEIQRHAMLMFTSCGWFFADISGLESVLVLRQAGKLIALTREWMGVDLEPGLLEILGGAESNIASITGRDIYEEAVAPYIGPPETADGLTRFESR